MANPEVNLLFHQPIVDHAFTTDGSVLAVTKDNSVELYERNGHGFTLKDELKGHDLVVTSVDIAPNSGKIVTCSQDRNAYVWEPTATGWKEGLVLLRINRAATFVRWSPNEEKFAVGSGARVIAICYFEEEGNWWVSKHLKKPIRSTILSVNWHPNSVLLAAGSADAHARVFSAFIKGVDQRPEPTPWGERLPFNTVCGEFLNNSGGWVHDVAFSPSGNALAFTAHDSSVTIVYPSGPDQPPQAVMTVSTHQLPFTTLTWITEEEIVAAGHDCEPFRFRGSVSQGWGSVGALDSSKSRSSSIARESSARDLFKQMDLKGKNVNTAATDDIQLKTIHQNTITRIRPYEGDAAQGGVKKISSSGIDGRIVIFPVGGARPAFTH